jgi:hypothetical protein
MDPETTISPKTKAAGIVALLTPVLLLLLDALIGYATSADGQLLLSGLPDWAQQLLYAVITAGATAYAAWRTRDPLRRAVNIPLP